MQPFILPEKTTDLGDYLNFHPNAALFKIINFRKYFKPVNHTIHHEKAI